MEATKSAMISSLIFKLHFAKINTSVLLSDVMESEFALIVLVLIFAIPAILLQNIALIGLIGVLGLIPLFQYIAEKSSKVLNRSNL